MALDAGSIKDFYIILFHSVLFFFLQYRDPQSEYRVISGIIFTLLYHRP